jgi:dTDP-4-dehydrorhamnose reductase
MSEESTLIYLSSARIFDGKQCGVSETQEPHPSDAYGARKLATEKIILESVKNYSIVRISKVITEKDWLFKKLANVGFSENGISLMRRKCVGVISLDQCSSMLTLLVNENIRGIIQFAPNKSMSYYELGRRYLEANNRKFLGRLTPDDSLPLRQHDCLENSTLFGPQKENFDLIWNGLNFLRL